MFIALKTHESLSVKVCRYCLEKIEVWTTPTPRCRQRLRFTESVNSLRVLFYINLARTVYHEPLISATNIKICFITKIALYVNFGDVKFVLPKVLNRSSHSTGTPCSGNLNKLLACARGLNCNILYYLERCIWCSSLVGAEGKILQGQRCYQDSAWSWISILYYFGRKILFSLTW